MAYRSYRCIQCGKCWLPERMARMNATRDTGLCKVCKHLNDKRYRLQRLAKFDANGWAAWRERLVVYNRTYKARHKASLTPAQHDAEKAKRRAYHARNHERVLRAARAWRAAHREQVQAACRNWRRAHLQQMRLYSRQYRERQYHKRSKLKLALERNGLLWELEKTGR